MERDGGRDKVMKGNRRDFIKVTASLGFLGVSDASAEAVKPFAGTPKIGIVHSTDFDGTLAQCFIYGLGVAGWAEQPTGTQKKVEIKAKKVVQGKYGYGHPTDLEDAVKGHLPGGVDLIVAAGGIAAATAAASALVGTQVPFVCLIGRMPETGIPPANNSGGVNLDTPGQNKQRVTELTTHFYNPPIDPTNVYLVVNANSQMTKQEVVDWNAAVNQNVMMFFEAAPNDNTNDNFLNYVKELATTSPKPSGLVISSDPYFRYDGNPALLTRALADELNIPVCYPFQEFKDAAPAASKSNSIVYGPQLSTSNSDQAEIAKTAYYQLGYKAGNVLKNRTASKPVPVLGYEKWVNSVWTHSA
jgi:hypothetical protein